MRFGNCGEMKHLVGRDHVLDAGNVGAVVGRAAGGDQDVFRGDGLAGREPQRVRVFEHRAGLDHAGAGFFDVGGVGALPAGRSRGPCWRSGSASRRSLREWSSRNRRRPRSRAGHARRRPAASSARSRGSRRCRPCGILRRSSPWRHGRRRSGRRARRPTLLRSRTDRRRTQPWQPLIPAPVASPSPLVGEGIAGVRSKLTWVRGCFSGQIVRGEPPHPSPHCVRRHLLPQGEKARSTFTTRFVRSACRACASRRGIHR